MSSYRPISLLSVISKVLVKLVLKMINTDVNPHSWIPQHQFGFRRSHSTIQQCHRIPDTINKALENHQYCTAVFLDVSQAFDKVWLRGLLYKIKQTLSPVYFHLLKSHLQDRHFVTKFSNETSSRFPIYSGVPQGSIRGPLLYRLYTSDFPTTPNTTLSTSADYTAIFAVHTDPMTASLKLQEDLHNIETWLQKWKMKVKENTSSHMTFSLRQEQRPPVYINQTVIPSAETVKYLGLHFDRRLTWKEQCHEKETPRS